MINFFYIFRRKKMKNNFKRCLALLMALMMIVGAFAIPVSAADSDCEHEWEVYAKKDPTCTTVGSTTYICTKCEEYEQRDLVAKLDHNYVKASAAKAPTCSTPGYKKDAMVCSVCSNVKDAKDVVAANGTSHVWDESKTKVEGDLCGVGGTVVTKKTCSLCDAKDVVVKTETGKGEHDYEYKVVTPATCAKEGLATRTCKVCKIVDEIKIEKLDHVDGKAQIVNGTVKFEKKEYKATDDKHLVVVYCVNCNEVTVKPELADHNFTSDADKLDQCKNPGFYTKTCKDCKRAVKVTVEETHTYNPDAPKKVVKGVHKKDQLVEGYKLYDCFVCGEEVKVVTEQANASKYHTIGDENTKLVLNTTTAGFYVAPTCIDEGYGRYECDCGYYVLAPIKANDHDLGAEVKGTPSCKEKYYDYKLCTVCGHKEITKTYDPVTNHKKDDVLEEKAATCFAAGYKKLGCAACNKVVTTVTKGYEQLTCDAKTYHTVTNNGASGCFVERVVTTTCSKCGGVKVEKFLYNAHLFTKEEVIEKATCDKTGKKGFKCGREDCGAIEITETIPFDYNNHSGGKDAAHSKGEYVGAYGKVTIEPTKLANITEAKTGVAEEYNCYKLNYTWWYCEGCDKEFEKVTVFTWKDVDYYSGSGVHPYGDPTFTDKDQKAPTCTATGIGTYECTVCGNQKKNAVVPALGHDVDQKKDTPIFTVPSTCIAKGYKIYKCKRCSTNIQIDEKDLGKHVKDAGTVTVDSTCSKTGTKVFKCTVCSVVIETKTVAEKAHGTIDKTKGWEVIAEVPATCTTNGTKEYRKCKDCNKLYWMNGGEQVEFTDPKTDKNIVIPAIEHKNGHYFYETIAPDCVNYGYDAYRCVDCDVEIYWDNYLSPLGHTATTNAEAGFTKEKDQNAAAVYSRKATCYAYAYTCNICSVCGKEFNIVEDKSTPKPPHVNADGYVLLGDCRVIIGDDACTVCKGTGVDANGVACSVCSGAYICANKKADGKTVCEAFVPAVCEFVNEVKFADCNVKRTECKFCDEYKFDLIDANKKATHTLVANEEASVAATLTKTGKSVKTCSVCGYDEVTTLPKLTAVVFSLEANNPNGGNIVNGGSVYVTVKIDALKIDVNNIRVAVDYDEKHLVFKGAVKSSSIFGALSEPVANAKDGVAYVFDDAGSERNNITIEGKMDFVTLEFYVKPDACNPKNRLGSVVKFVEPTGELANSVMFYDVETDKYNTYTYDVKKNEKIDLKIDQLGDFDNNGNVNNYDLVAVRDAITNGNAYDAVLDIDHDGEITIKDYKYIKEYMVATYDYWMFADLVSYNNWLAVKDNKVSANDSAKYFEWLAK
jgi:hypothetical protein